LSREEHSFSSMRVLHTATRARRRPGR
jgi:hypothetical protein